MITTIIVTALTTLILVHITLTSKYFELERRLDKKDNEDIDLVVCEKSKLLLRKEDAVRVKVIQRANFYLNDDGIRYKYYSPLYAPKYDVVDEESYPTKYFKTVKESQVEVKVPKTK